MRSVFESQADEFGAVSRDYLFVRGDHGFPGFQCAANPVGRRLHAANDFDHNVSVRRKNVAELLRPTYAGGQPIHFLALDVAVANVSKPQAGGRVFCKNACDRTAHRSETHYCNL